MEERKEYKLAYARIKKEMENTFKKDGILICSFCGKKMKHWMPQSGKFKGQEQKYSFVCDCEKGSKLILSMGTCLYMLKKFAINGE